MEVLGFRPKAGFRFSPRFIFPRGKSIVSICVKNGPRPLRSSRPRPHGAAAKFRGAQSSHEVVERALPGKTGGNFELLRECAHVSRPRPLASLEKSSLCRIAALSLSLSLSLSFSLPLSFVRPDSGIPLHWLPRCSLVQGLHLGVLQVDRSIGMVDCEDSLWNKRTLCRCSPRARHRSRLFDRDLSLFL